MVRAGMSKDKTGLFQDSARFSSTRELEDVLFQLESTVSRDSKLFEDHLGGWAVAYNVKFIPVYCCAYSKAVRAHSVFVVCPGMLECVVKLGGYNVNSMLCADLKEF